MSDDEKLPHTARIEKLLAEGKKKEAAELEAEQDDWRPRHADMQVDRDTIGLERNRLEAERDRYRAAIRGALVHISDAAGDFMDPRDSLREASRLLAAALNQQEGSE